MRIAAIDIGKINFCFYIEDVDEIGSVIDYTQDETVYDDSMTETQMVELEYLSIPFINVMCLDDTINNDTKLPCF